MRGLAAAPGAARLHLADGVPLLRPDEQVFQAMLDGWRNQQLARNLARSTVEGREGTVRAFAGYVSADPWAWTPAMVDEWLGDLRSPSVREAGGTSPLSDQNRMVRTGTPTRLASSPIVSRGPSFSMAPVWLFQ